MNTRNKTYLTWFDDFTPVEMVKSPGMIITHLARQNPEWNFILAGHTGKVFDISGDYPSNLSFQIKPSGLLKSLWFFVTHARSISILHLYHIKPRTGLLSLVYRLFNRKGKIYIKLDADYRIRRYYESGLLRRMMRAMIVKSADLISVETNEIYQDLLARDPALGKKLFINPYGIDIREAEAVNQLGIQKKNQMITIGRLGTYQKNTEMLLEALGSIKNAEGWEFVVAGPYDKEFQPVIESFFTLHPGLRETVRFTGNISDRKELLTLLAQSRVFLLTSRFESWGIVLTEAGYFGNYIISTDTGCAGDLVRSTGCGVLIEQENAGRLRSEMEKVIRGGVSFDPGMIHRFCREHYDWGRITASLWEKLNNA